MHGQSKKKITKKAIFFLILIEFILNISTTISMLFVMCSESYVQFECTEAFLLTEQNSKKLEYFNKIVITP